MHGRKRIWCGFVAREKEWQCHDAFSKKRSWHYATRFFSRSVSRNERIAPPVFRPGAHFVGLRIAEESVIIAVAVARDGPLARIVRYGFDDHRGRNNAIFEQLNTQGAPPRQSTFRRGPPGSLQAFQPREKRTSHGQFPYTSVVRFASWAALMQCDDFPEASHSAQKKVGEFIPDCMDVRTA